MYASNIYFVFLIIFIHIYKYILVYYERLKPDTRLTLIKNEKQKFVVKNISHFSLFPKTNYSFIA